MSSDVQNEANEFDEERFRVVDGRFEITPAGLERYRERFARAGFDITKITTLDGFEAALEGSFHIELEAAETMVMNKKYSNALEGELLRAVIRGDEAEKARISEKLRRRDLLSLQVIIGGASCEAPR